MLPAPAARALGGHRPAVQLHQVANEGQPDAQAALGSVDRVVGLRERLEDAGQDARVDPDPVVSDPNLSHPALRRHSDLDAPAARRVLERVGQKIVQDLLQAHGVALRGEARAGGPKRELDPVAHREGPMRLHAALDQLGQVDRHSDDGDLSQSQPGEIQEVVDQPRQQVGLPADHSALAGQRLGILVLHQLDRRQHRRQRVAQLVAEHRQETIPLADTVLELDQQVPDLVLARPRSQGGLDRRDQCHLPGRAIDERDVGMLGELSNGRGDALGAVLRSREHENGKVGPRQLAAEDLGQIGDGLRRQHFLGQEERARARPEAPPADPRCRRTEPP